MTQSSISTKGASAFSLAAITAGAVAAALPIMSVGFMMAIISLGAISGGGAPAVKAGSQHATNMRTVAQWTPQLDKAHVKTVKKSKANYLMDAVLREDERHVAPRATQRKPSSRSAPVSHVIHVFA